MDTPYCKIHNKPLQFKTWIAKTGKKAGKECRAWKCDEMNCSEIIWADSPKERVYSPKPTQQDASIIVGLRELYDLNLAIAHLLNVQPMDIEAELLRMKEERINK